MEAVDEESISVQSHRSEQHLSVASSFMLHQTSYLFTGNHLPLVHRHTLLRKRSVMLFKLKKERRPEATFVLPSHIFQTGCGSVTSPYTCTTLTSQPPSILSCCSGGLSSGVTI